MPGELQHQHITSQVLASNNVPACLADREYIKKVQDAGFEFHVWTVDSPEYAKQLQAVGVDHITTNCPSVLYQALTEADD